MSVSIVNGEAPVKDVLKSNHCARMLKALADPERLRIIQCLRKGPMNVSELSEALEAPIVKISHHLKVLRGSDVVLDEKQGRFVNYQLNPAVYQPTESEGHLELGCCRLEIPQGR